MRRALALLGVLAWAACKRASAPVPPDAGVAPAVQTARVLTEIEPNDTAAQAQALPFGVPLRGTFQSPQDQDWYRLGLADAGSLRVQVRADAGRPELEVRSNEALLAAYRAQAAGEGIFVRDLALALGVPDGGTPDAGYLLLLKRGAGDYTLSAAVEPAPPDLEIEPNDAPAQATPLSSSASGYLSPKGDQDWYVVHADAPSVLQAQVSGLARDVELAAFEVPDGGKPRQLARMAEDGGTQILPALALQGDGYLRVRMRSPDEEDRDGLYKLTASLSPDDGTLDREPNDSVAAAQPVPLPVTLRGHLWPKRDIDFFRFHVEAGHPPVSIVLTPPRSMPLALRLYELHQGSEPEVIGSSAAAQPSLIAVPLKEGDYAVEVYSPRREASPTEVYELRLSP